MNWNRIVLFIFFLSLGAIAFEAVTKFFSIYYNHFIFLYLIMPLVALAYVLFLIWKMKLMDSSFKLKKIAFFFLFIIIWSTAVVFLNRLYNVSYRGVAIYTENKWLITSLPIFILFLAKIMKIFDENTTWKRLLIFFLQILAGIAIFAAISSFTISISFLLVSWLFIAYITTLIISGEPYSKEKRIILFAIPLIYLFIMVVPAPFCSSSSFWTGQSSSCTCIGLEKSSFGIIDASGSECVGFPTNYRCHNLSRGYGEGEIPCEAEKLNELSWEAERAVVRTVKSILSKFAKNN